jgi:hypothetical protein
MINGGGGGGRLRAESFGHWTRFIIIRNISMISALSFLALAACSFLFAINVGSIGQSFTRFPVTDVAGSDLPEALVCSYKL